MSARRGLSATEGVLAMAAACTHEELVAGRLAVIGSGRQVLEPLDRSLLVAGDGTAGRVLLGGSLADRWEGEPTSGRRSLVLDRREAADRLEAEQERRAAGAGSARDVVVPIGVPLGARDLWDVVDGLEGVRPRAGGGS